MCHHASIEKVVVLSMNGDAEGITTMPVSCHDSCYFCKTMQDNSKTDFNRSLVDDAQPAWREEILCGSSLESAAHSVAHP
jgi:hypothetical protein